MSGSAVCPHRVIYIPLCCPLPWLKGHTYWRQNTVSAILLFIYMWTFLTMNVMYSRCVLLSVLIRKAFQNAIPVQIKQYLSQNKCVITFHLCGDLPLDICSPWFDHLCEMTSGFPSPSVIWPSSSTIITRSVMTIFCRNRAGFYPLSFHNYVRYIFHSSAETEVLFAAVPLWANPCLKRISSKPAKEINLSHWLDNSTQGL